MSATLKRWLQIMVMLGLLAVASPVQAFYNPSSGRWLSRDPISEQGDLNLNSFTCNDPQNSIDPVGKETVQVWVRTEIRPPHFEDGIKTIHSVTINEYGSKTAETTHIGVTPFPVPLPGVGLLASTVSGTHPQFEITLTGSAFSILPVASGVVVGTTPGGSGIIPGTILRNLVIDYAITIQLDFCSRKGSVSGAHDGFPSYVVSVKGKRVYDFQQTILPALLPPMDVSPNASFNW